MRDHLVFKILRAEEPLHGPYPGGPTDIVDGFIHLCASDQLAATLGAHFSDASRVWVLGFDAAELGPRLRFEPSRGGAFFPHLYGVLQLDLARSRNLLERGQDGVWPELTAS
jgi:uncharacterized protein (DUF952 family)